MRFRQYVLCLALSAAGLLLTASTGRAYVETPYTLGRICQDSTNIILLRVEKVDREKNLIFYRKVRDLKGKHAGDEIKHNIGKSGYHPREWQYVMLEAEVGKTAVMFHNGGASETCLGTYWYQSYNGGAWWSMSHGEPFLLRTFYGKAERLPGAVDELLAGREVIVPCMADGNKEDFHVRKGRTQLMRASLKLNDYNPRRDFVAWQK